jgi:hypothetical protein
MIFAILYGIGALIYICVLAVMRGLRIGSWMDSSDYIFFAGIGFLFWPLALFSFLFYHLFNALVKWTESIKEKIEERKALKSAQHYDLEEDRKNKIANLNTTDYRTVGTIGFSRLK